MASKKVFRKGRTIYHSRCRHMVVLLRAPGAVLCGGATFRSPARESGRAFTEKAESLPTHVLLRHRDEARRRNAVARSFRRTAWRFGIVGRKPANEPISNDRPRFLLYSCALPARARRRF